MQFANLDFWWLLICVPLGAALGLLRKARLLRQLEKFADAGLLPALGATQNESKRSGIRYLVFLFCVTLLLVVAVLRPQWGFTWKESRRSGIDLVFAVDVSESMLARDVSPDRLQRARRKIEDMLARLRGDRVALVSFAGNAFIEAPLTQDYRAFHMFVNLLDTSLIPVPGSNIETALAESLKALGFKDDEPTSGKRNGAIIIFSDGEELDGDFESKLKLAKDAGVRIFAMGLGTPEGSPITTPSGYKKDKNGKVVITKLHPEILEKLAVETGGLYVQSVGSDRDVKALYDDGIKRSLADNQKSSGKEKRWQEYFQLPLFLAALLMLLGPWRSRAAKATSSRAVVAGRETVLAAGNALLWLLLLAAPAKAESPERIGADARENYDHGDFSESLKDFEAGGNAAAQDFRFDMGQGSSLYRLNDFQKAQGSFFSAAGKAVEPKDKANALYNAGNSLVQQQHYKEAIKAYDDSLAVNPKDQEAIDNREYARKLLEEQKQQKKDEQNKQQQQNKQQNKDDKNDQNQEKKQDNKQDNNQDQKQDKDQQQNKDQQKDDQQKDQQQKQDEKQQSNEQQKQEQQKQQDKEDQQQKNSEQQKQDPQKDQKQDSKDRPEDQQQKEGEQNPDQQKQDKQKDEQKKDQQDAKNPGEDKDQPPEDAERGGGEQQGERGKRPRDEVDTILDSVQEKEGIQLKYRQEKAMREMRSGQRKAPDRDW